MINYSIAIDGPAGSGKSTVAKRVAKELNFNYVNSGLFYRAIGIYLDQKGINYNVETKVSPKVLNNIKLSWKNGEMFLDSAPINNEAFKQKYANIASVIAQYKIVREFVNMNIQELSNKLNVVVDGRDIGTIVLPNATVKIFLDADVTVRALRRLKQQSEGNGGSNINSVINDIIQRDNRDYSRPIAPLAKAHDAYLIDCSEMTIEETVDQIKRYFMGKVINATNRKEE